MDWADFWTKLGGGLIGALIGGSVVSYFSSYYSKKGERALIREELPQILEEERDKAYQQEAGKRLATHEDIESVLKEIRLVTRETETIKAQIGSDLWTRQTVWQQKREAYFAILRASHALEKSLVDLNSTRMILSQVHQQGLPERELPVELATRAMEYAEAHRKFLDAVNEAEIFLESIGRLRGEYLTHLDRIERSAATDEDKTTQKALVLGKWTQELIKVAKKDLGMETN
jgi:hypothetical protein